LIVFDLDDTLIDTSTYISPFQLKKTYLSLIQEGLSIDDPEKTLVQLLQTLKKEKSATRVLKNFLLGKKLNKKYSTLVDEGLTSPLPSFFEVKTFPNVKEILEKLVRRHSLCIVSRGKESYQRQKIQKAGIDVSFFSKIIVTPKDNKKIYYNDLKNEFGVDSFLVCGDRIESDLIPAKELGAITVHTREVIGHSPGIEREHVDYTIDCFKQIEEIIQKLEGLKNGISESN